MEDEEKKQRYLNIIYRLQVIDSKISSLTKSMLALEKTSRASIEIDGEAFIKDELGDYKKTIEEASRKITNTIIPSLKKKTKE